MITLVLAMSLFTVSAQAASQNGLSEAFNELKLSLDLRDPSNEAEYKAAVANFKETVQKIAPTTQEVVALVKSEIKDAKLAKDMETALNIVAINKMSSAEASKYMVEAMERSGAKGASWNGAASALLGLGVLLVVAAVLVGGGAVYYGGNSCVYGYSSWYCGETCYGYPYYYCEANYCCY